MHRERADLEGLCRFSGCELPAIQGGRCFHHLVCLFLHRRNVLPNGHASVDDETQRGKFALRLRAHYNKVVSGDIEPSSQRQKLTKAWELRNELGISWGGARGLLGTAEVVGDVEKLARKEAD